MSDVEEKTISDEVVVTKYKTAGDIVNSKLVFKITPKDSPNLFKSLRIRDRNLATRHRFHFLAGDLA